MGDERPPRFLYDSAEEAIIASIRMFVRSQSSGDQAKLIAFFHLLEQQTSADIDLQIGPDDENLTLTVKAKARPGQDTSF